MQSLVSIILIGISLSMDTFSLSLSLASSCNQKNTLFVFPFLVAIFHFIFPLLGNILGLEIMLIFNLASHIVLGSVLLFLGTNILLSLFKETSAKITLSFFSMLILAISVSIDALMTGLGITDITSSVYLASIIFSLCSFIFTFTALLIGKYFSDKAGSFASLIGALLLLGMGLYLLIN